jgi:hypothetical protein
MSVPECAVQEMVDEAERVEVDTGAVAGAESA